MDPSPSFGYWVRRRRKSLDLTQEELARQVACALTTIKKIERDERRPSRLMAERLAESLQIAAEERKLFIQAARAERSSVHLPLASAPPPTQTATHLELEAENIHLPLPATRLIGRQVELAELRAHLHNAEIHLLTLTGPPGVGKTRLAVQVALEETQTGQEGIQSAIEAQQEFPDGVYFIDLAPLSSGDLVLPTVAAALGISLSGRPEETLLSALRRKRVLLLFDNCEHLVEACAQLAHRLITTCPQVKILATSRQPLGVPEEYVYPVLPLPVPDMQFEPELKALARNESVSLFSERAAAMRPDFILSEANAHSVGEICTHLDGLPLAIELAAARVSVLSPAHIAARLKDSLHLLTRGSRASHAHQQTLRATLDWSHALLTPGERVLFRRLAVFDGSFSLEAAESVCPDQELVAKDEVLDLLSRLIDHSLVKVVTGAEEMRYRLLETMRQYAGERLAASGEEAKVRLRRIAYYHALVKLAETHFFSAEAVTWFDRLELEADNLRGALEHALTLSSQSGAEMAVALGRFWLVRGFHSEGLDWLKRCLEVVGDTPAELGVKTDLCHWATEFAVNLMLSGDGLELAERGLELAHTLQDPRRIAYALYDKGLADFVLDYKTQPVLETLDQALVLFRQVQDEFGVTRSLMTMGQVYEGISERGLASRYYLESLQKFRQAGEQRGVAYLNHRLGWLAKWYGDLGVAEAHFEESLAIARQFGAHSTMAHNLLGLGECAYRRGKYAQAIQYLGEANLLNSRMGNREIEVCILYALGNIERLEGNYGNAREMLSQALALSQEYGLIKDTQLTLGYLAKVDCSLGNYHQATLRMEQALKTRANMDTYQEIYLENLEAIIIYAFAVQKDSQAAQLWGAVEAYRERQEMVRYPVDTAEIEPIRQGLQDRLGEAGFAEAYEQGQSLTLEQAVSRAEGMLAALKSDEAQPA